MSDVNIVQKLAGTTLSDGINKYFYIFCVFFIVSVLELNCHTVYTSDNVNVFIMKKILILQSTRSLILTLYSLDTHSNIIIAIYFGFRAAFP
jgi:hypothetical protein